MTKTRGEHRTGRRLVLIDIENLVGNPSPLEAEVHAALHTLSRAIPGFQAAQRVVACSHHAACAVSFAVAGCRRLWRSGPNGADLALLDVLNTESVEDRFQYVTVCSGDGIFADAVTRLTESGVIVDVVALKGRLARRLQPFARPIPDATASAAPAYEQAG